MKGSGTIGLNDLPDKIKLNSRKTGKIISSIEISDDGLYLNETMGQFEKDLLQKALQKSGGVKSRAAKLLNLNRTTLVEKLKRYNIS
jgi:DNA-binding NtrC family response regulator